MDNFDLTAYYEKGKALLELQKYQEAIVCFDKAIEIYPNFVFHYYEKGKALHELQKYQEAIVCFDKAIEIYPNFVFPYYEKGKALQELQKYQEAIVCFDKAIEIYPNFVFPYYEKGLALLELQKYQEAIECFDKVIEINPNYSTSYYGKGVSLFILEKYQEAIECFDKVIEINPNKANYYYEKGNALLKLEKYQEAIECFDKVIEINPNNANAYYEKGNALLKLEKYQEAIVCFDKTIEYNPNNANAYYNREFAFQQFELMNNAFTQENTIIESQSNVFSIEEINNARPYDQIKLVKPLGLGSTGKVLLGEFNLREVAVKEIIEVEQLNIIELVYKLHQLKLNLCHPNLINYIGFKIEEGKLRVIMDLSKGGNLFSLLHTSNVTFSINQKLKILLDSATGLDFLHSQQPPYMHREINSKNIFIAEEVIEGSMNFTCKIKDKNISREIREGDKYKNTQNRNTLWKCIEVLNGEEFVIKLDVYSFGIFMWEVFAQKIPFSDLHINSELVYSQWLSFSPLRPKLNLLPNETPTEIINLMAQCWHEDYKKRPSMKDVIQTLQTLLN